MRKQRIEYSSPLDALVAVAKRLSTYETRLVMNSETFYDRYTKGELPDNSEFIEWADDYRHYLSISASPTHRRQPRPGLLATPVPCIGGATLLVTLRLNPSLPINRR